MQLPKESELLRIFVSESDRFEGRPLYQALVEEAFAAGLAGATAMRGVLGFGAGRRIHTSKVLRLSEDLPMVVEIVDAPDRIEAFLPRLDAMMQGGLITLERSRVLAYRPGSPGGAA